MKADAAQAAGPQNRASRVGAPEAALSQGPAVAVAERGALGPGLASSGKEAGPGRLQAAAGQKTPRLRLSAGTGLSALLCHLS